MRPADKAWLSLLVAVVAYEAAAPKGELLSEGWERYLRQHPVIATATPFLVAGHLTNTLPPYLDPISGIFRLCRFIAAE